MRMRFGKAALRLKATQVVLAVRDALSDLVGDDKLRCKVLRVPMLALHALLRCMED
jgi:hypothetical protein